LLQWYDPSLTSTQLLTNMPGVDLFTSCVHRSNVELKPKRFGGWDLRATPAITRVRRLDACPFMEDNRPTLQR
jgi:hypothetical protein